MRAISLVLALSLASSAALAANSGQLSSGHPAGVKQAQEVSNPTALYVLVGMGAISLLAVAVSGGGDHSAVPGGVSSSTSAATTTTS